ncbi:MAG: Ig-like domain-containing protein [Gemmatimonadales bacterium]
MVSFVATDADGDTVSDSFDVSIVDDVPTANDDTDAVLAGQSTTGNVITGVDPESPDADFSATLVADALGADGATITAVTSADEISRTGTLAGGDLVITTDDGTLEISADGSYTYTANGNPLDTSDVFTYTLTDADGDTAAATLTIDAAGVRFPSGLSYTIAGVGGGGGGREQQPLRRRPGIRCQRPDRVRLRGIRGQDLR